MQLWSGLLFFLLLHLGTAEEERSDAAGMQADEPGRLCQYDEKQLHITVRSAAVSALKGLCNPGEMETRLQEMEARLSQKLEEIKNSFNRILTQSSASERTETERNRQTARTSENASRSVTAAADRSDDTKLSQANDHRGQRRSSRRRASAKRYSASHRRNGATGQQRTRSSSHSGHTEYNDTRSSSGQSATRLLETEASSRATNSFSGNGSMRAGSTPSSTYDFRDRFASSQSTRASNIRSVGADAYRATSGEGSDSSATNATPRRDHQVAYAGTQRTGSSSRDGARLNERFIAEGSSGKIYRYELVPRRGYADMERPITTVGNLQYETHSEAQHASGLRQVSSSSLGSRTGRGSEQGDQVTYSSSYTPSAVPEPYSSYGGSRQQPSSRARRPARRQPGGRRRGQQVTDTVSFVSSSESALQSRFREMSSFNDTVYEMNGKRMYSYYWQVMDFDTMMATWEEKHSLRSPSFYVYQGGYRMYIRIFPSRQGGNVYLHAGLTPGRYDDSLRWPFRLRLRLSLLDHSAVTHDIQSRIWDPTQLCSGFNWRKPNNKDNYECVGLGFPQELLRSRRFIVDGSVLIKLDVILVE